ncbi:MAG: succinate dehydrogenase flavoprotein subunit [Chlamydiia bacterium]|nr:succinate dehydrogenase flavoprotein subunit [Chlamydiia bacterium]
MIRQEVVVIGGGLAGLSAALRLAEKGCFVKIVSVTKVKRSHSVCAQGGINAAMNLKGEDDSPFIHAYDTIKGGDFLANQPPILEMCLAAPYIIQMLDRFGCPFNRNPSGHLDVRRFGGTLYHRTVFCGATTGQQLLYTLDEQVRRWEAKGFIEKYENHEFLRLVTCDQGKARGVVVVNLFNQTIEVLKGDAVVVATGGPGLIFKKSTNSTFCTGAANARLYLQGMQYANGEFIQIHPTAIPGQDKLRLISESVRGEGGRIWVWGDENKQIQSPNGDMISCGKKGEPWYFLEEMYPGYGNLVGRDVGAREVMRVCEMGLGIDGQMQVHLDVTHLPEETKHKLEAVLDIYKKFTGDDPRKVPMRIYPAVHYSMGGGWVDWPAVDDVDRETRFRQMTNIPGLFNIGESDYQYHGANRLGANSLLSCIFSGLIAGEEIPRYIDTLDTSFRCLKEEVYQKEIDIENNSFKEMMNRNGKENIFMLHEELAEMMVRHVTVRRTNRGLAETMEKIKELKERYKNISLDDTGRFVNQSLQFAHQFQGMLELSLVMTKGALLRDEFRGSHYKPEFPERDDEHWLKTTIATYNSTQDEPMITYESVDTRHLEPTKRDYRVAKKICPELKNVPKNISLPA